MADASQSGEPDCPGYSSWEQVAGYFDGDGNVGLEVVKRVIRFKLRFVDTWRPQVSSIASFLKECGIRSSKIGKDVKKSGNWHPGYRLDITEVRSVIEAAKAMLPHTVKKREELRAVLDYLDGRSTGNDVIKVFNEETKSGRRRGKVREEKVPYHRAEGLRLSQLENARHARAASTRSLSVKISRNGSAKTIQIRSSVSSASVRSMVTRPASSAESSANDGHHFTSNGTAFPLWS